MTELEVFLKQIRLIVRRNIAASTPDKINSEIDDFRRRSGVKKKVQKEISQAVHAETKLMLDEFLQKRLGELSEASVKQFTDAESAITTKVKATVSRLIRSKRSDSDIDRALSVELGVQERHVRTVRETTRAAVSQAQVISDASGVMFYRYMGPTKGVRKFCSDHVGKVYHVSEIERMDNGQGLPVLFYKGGYNCRHRWVAVSLETARAERPEWFDEKGNLKSSI